MCKGVGLDLCEIDRMEKLKDHAGFLERFLTPGEREYVQQRGRAGAQSLAGIFAAKEAFSKAMGTGIAFSLQEVEVIHDERGQPAYRLTGEAAALAGGDVFFLSITHDGGMAASVCVRDEG